MTYQEFDSRFKKQVARLSQQKQLDLVLNICKKLFFDYQTFHEKNEWGNPDVLLDGIHLIESSRTKKLQEDLIKAAIKKIEEVTPDTEDFGDASYALNACCAVCSTLDFLLESKPEHIYYVGTSLYDTIDAKVQEDDDLSEEEIDKHPLIVETKRYLLEETQ